MAVTGAACISMGKKKEKGGTLPDFLFSSFFLFYYFTVLFFIVSPFLQALWRPLMADLLNCFTLLIF